jgi:hypothetical protein
MLGGFFLQRPKIYLYGFGERENETRGSKLTDIPFISSFIQRFSLFILDYKGKRLNLIKVLRMEALYSFLLTFILWR